MTFLCPGFGPGCATCKLLLWGSSFPWFELLRSRGAQGAASPTVSVCKSDQAGPGWEAGMAGKAMALGPQVSREGWVGSSKTQFQVPLARWGSDGVTLAWPGWGLGINDVLTKNTGTGSSEQGLSARGLGLTPHSASCPRRLQARAPAL